MLGMFPERLGLIPVLIDWNGDRVNIHLLIYFSACLFGIFCWIDGNNYISGTLRSSAGPPPDQRTLRSLQKVAIWPPSSFSITREGNSRPLTIEYFESCDELAEHCLRKEPWKVTSVSPVFHTVFLSRRVGAASIIKIFVLSKCYRIIVIFQATASESKGFITLQKKWSTASCVHETCIISKVLLMNWAVASHYFFTSSTFSSVSSASNPLDCDSPSDDADSTDSSTTRPVSVSSICKKLPQTGLFRLLKKCFNLTLRVSFYMNIGCHKSIIELVTTFPLTSAKSRLAFTNSCPGHAVLQLKFDRFVLWIWRCAYTMHAHDTDFARTICYSGIRRIFPKSSFLPRRLKPNIPLRFKLQTPRFISLPAGPECCCLI